MLKIKVIIASIVTLFSAGSSIFIAHQIEQEWLRPCDGIEISTRCTGDDGVRYAKYIFHPARREETETITHPAQPAITHTVHHDAVYGTRQVISGCIQTDISYKKGTCALSRCRDGSYSGSTGRGTCSYHGGVWYSGGPWYEYKNEVYVVTPAWDETVVDVPAKEAWTEVVIVSPAVAEYYEKEEAK